MGLFSSSRSSSKNYSYVDNSYTETHTYTDAGAIEAGKGIAETALDLARFSVESVGSREAMALQAMEDYGNNALEKVAQSYQESDAETMQTIFKYTAITAAVVGVAFMLKGKL